jgi:simple sugar transport system permease protein
MQSKQIPKEITFIIQGMIVIFIALRSALILYQQYLDKKKLQKEVGVK